jgi:hypothetical protein
MACHESSDIGGIGEPIDGAETDVEDVTVGDLHGDTEVAPEPCEQDADCDDGNPCTANVCAVGAVCETLAQDGVVCDDGDACTTGDACNASGQCAGQALANVPDDPCTVCSCSADRGIECEYAPDGTECVANPSVCTDGDTCQIGQCIPGEVAPIDDGNPCTEDSCDKGQVVNTPLLEGSCDDENPCTTGDHCKLGNCEPGEPVVCIVEACAADSHCDSEGECVQTWLPQGSACEDGNACTSGDACDANHACLGDQASCDDSNPCTVDSCDLLTGECVSEGSELLDDLPCIPGGEVVCATGAHCFAGVCVPEEEGDCDDGDPCTEDLCGLDGCTSTASATTDGAACDLDGPCVATATCYDGACTKELDVACDDGVSCTFDECEAGVGCVYTPADGETVGCDQVNDIDDDGCCCFADDPTGTYKSAQVLDVGIQIAGTEVTCCITPGLEEGCQDTAYLGVSEDGVFWTEVDSFPTITVPTGGFWEAVCTDLVPEVDYRYVRGANENCYVDHFICEAPCDGPGCLGLGGESCDDANPCTYDACSPDTGCSHEPVASNACLILDDGNNLVSFSRLPVDVDPLNVFGDQANYVARIMGEGEITFPWGAGGDFIGNLELERTAGYWVNMNLPDGVPWVAIPLAGEATDPDIAYQLSPNVESISFPCDAGTPIIEAMGVHEPSFDQWIGQGIAAFKPTDTWIGSLTTFKTNDGYEVIPNVAITDFRFTCAGSDGVDPYTYGCTDPLASNYVPSADTDDETCAYDVPEGWENPGYVSNVKGQAWALFYAVGGDPGDAIGAFAGGNNIGFGMIDPTPDTVASTFTTVALQVGNQGVGLGPISFQIYDASEGTTSPVEITPEDGDFLFGLNSVTHFGCKEPTAGNYASWADIDADICTP